MRANLSIWVQVRLEMNWEVKFWGSFFYGGWAVLESLDWFINSFKKCSQISSVSRMCEPGVSYYFAVLVNAWVVTCCKFNFNPNPSDPLHSVCSLSILRVSRNSYRSKKDSSPCIPNISKINVIYGKNQKLIQGFYVFRAKN